MVLIAELIIQIDDLITPMPYTVEGTQQCVYSAAGAAAAALTGAGASSRADLPP